MDRPIVPLEQAWFWECPSCGKGNYARSVEVSHADVPEDTLRAMLDLEPWQPLPEGVEGQFVAAPESVACAHCEAEFDCFSPDEDEDVDPDDQGELGGELDQGSFPDVLPDDFD